MKSERFVLTDGVNFLTRNGNFTSEAMLAKIFVNKLDARDALKAFRPLMGSMFVIRRLGDVFTKVELQLAGCAVARSARRTIPLATMLAMVEAIYLELEDLKDDDPVDASEGFTSDEIELALKGAGLVVNTFEQMFARIKEKKS